MTAILETPRLRLGPWRLDHFEALARLYADEDTTRFIGGMADKAGAWNILHMRIGFWAAHGFGTFAIEEAATGGFVGWSGVLRPFDWPEHELGYALARPYWGKGYATEAGGSALAWAFGTLGLTSLVSYIHPDNTASVRVAERLGARLDGTHLLRGTTVQVYRHHRPEPASA